MIRGRSMPKYTTALVIEMPSPRITITGMPFELQPRLDNELIKLEPLEAGDFEVLYAVAADPLIWEQHPSKDRYQRPVFENFFKGAMESGGAFRVIDNTNGELIGSSRYSGYEEAKRKIDIAYTFIARRRWAP